MAAELTRSPEGARHDQEGLMTTGFNPVDFVNRIGERLVFEFVHAGLAGTPGLIGAAREHPARKQLEKLLPASASVGSGIVFDSFGARSAQQDIVFYERDYCPVYSLNDTPEATYFPVEGVTATGEVKSVLDKSTLFDALGKIRSAKVLRRFSARETHSAMPPAAPFRAFGVAPSFACVQSEEYDQGRKYRDQVFGFILCKAFKYNPETVLANLCEFGNLHGTDHMPNIIVSLDDGFVQHVSVRARALQRSPLSADGVAFVPDKPRAFAMLVNALREHVQQARTVPLSAYDRYMASLTGEMPNSTFRYYVGDGGAGAS